MSDPTRHEKLHTDQLEIDADLVRRLLRAQFPQWAELPIQRFASTGTENALYRLGDDLVARLPLRPVKSEQVEKLHRWLPRLAPHLPLAVPVPLAKGEPDEGYPAHWSVYPWFEGEEAVPDRIADLDAAAIALAEFVGALQRVDATGGPKPGHHNFWRGQPLAQRDAYVRSSIDALDGIIDTPRATATWDACVNAPAWDGPPLWLHGDLAPGNLLAVDGRIRAVIDWGGLGVGDPACELQVGWNLLPAASRSVFRGALGVDDATWTRGRGWALSVALIALPYYLETNPAIVRCLRPFARCSSC